MPAQTVFVVGAGASCEYNLPIGNDLKRQIGRVLRAANSEFDRLAGQATLFDVFQHYTQFNNSAMRVDNLCAAAAHISKAMPLAPSIDNFIHAHNGNREVELCGKIAIAHEILRAESGSKLAYPAKQSNIGLEAVENTWLVALVKLLFEDCTIEQLAERLSCVTFIVFNYDRCIEHFLYHAIQTYYGVAPTEAASLVAEMRIYHPYGVVGRLPWQHEGVVAQAISFGGQPERHELLNIAKAIKTFTEGTDDQSSDIIAIRAAMEAAQRIVYLGFAYHRLNVDLLLGSGRLTTANARRAFGTAFGMSGHDTDSVLGSLTTRLHAPSMAVRNDLKCVDLFHEYSRALSFV